MGLGFALGPQCPARQQLLGRLALTQECCHRHSCCCHCCCRRLPQWSQTAADHLLLLLSMSPPNGHRPWPTTCPRPFPLWSGRQQPTPRKTWFLRPTSTGIGPTAVLPCTFPGTWPAVCWRAGSCPRPQAPFAAAPLQARLLPGAGGPGPGHRGRGGVSGGLLCWLRLALLPAVPPPGPWAAPRGRLCFPAASPRGAGWGAGSRRPLGISPGAPCLSASKSQGTPAAMPDANPQSRPFAPRTLREQPTFPSATCAGTWRSLTRATCS